MQGILNYRNGSVVNCFNAKKEGQGVVLQVVGAADVTADVTFNGIKAQRSNYLATAEVPITESRDAITMEIDHPVQGKMQQTIQIRYDRNEEKRYNFFIDDNIFCMTDIAKERPASLFDHFYMKFLREMHQKYGTLFTLNMFYKNDHTPFELKDFPACYKTEFMDNADWLKLSFHAYSEFPDRPYQNASEEKLASDFDLLKSEICRFAGEASFIPPVALHWSMAKPEGLDVLHEKGVRVLCAQFSKPKTSLTERNDGERIYDIGYFCSPEDFHQLEQTAMFHNFKHDITFLKSTLICNYYTPEQIVDVIHQEINNNSGFLALETHEQYSYPYYFNYLPDHLQRIETSIRTATELGYKPVLFADDFLKEF